MQNKVYIILLNWNGWKDTIECIKSIINNTYVNYQIVVCDNDSSDGSIMFIKEGLIKLGKSFIEYEGSEKSSWLKHDNEKVIIIKNNENLGFAGGNNVGIEYAMYCGDCIYLWILNNDTVIEKDAIESLVSQMSKNIKCGICGSKIIYYDSHNIVQAYGGANYNKWFGLSIPIGNGNDSFIQYNRNYVLKNLKCIIGASMFVKKEFIDDVGLMCEDYFLYFEELDWAVRGARHKNSYELDYAPNSIVYHKEGASIGSNHNPKKRSLISDYYGLKNRILFTKKFYKYALPSVYLSVLLSVLIRLKRGQWEHFVQGVKVIFDSIFKDRRNHENCD